MTEELKLCPFCGGRVVLRKTVHSVYMDGRMDAVYSVYCDGLDRECPMQYSSIQHYESKEAAIAAWNRRVNDND